MERLSKLSKYFLIPQRYILSLMGFFAGVNAYTLRICLSLTITEMVAHVSSSNKSKIYDPDACPGVSDVAMAVTDKKHLYEWDEETQGLILGSYYWGYVITHIPAGLLSEKFGGKHVLGLGLLITALFTLLTPVIIIKSGGNWKVLVALRFCVGLGSGPLYPALNMLLAKWVPASERATMGTLVYAGGQMGTIVGNSMSGVLIEETKDWCPVFYTFGAIGLLWNLLWTLLCYSEPATHPFISEKEKTFLEQEIGPSHKNIPTPWIPIFKSVPIWAIIIAQTGHDWGYFTMASDLPKYMKEVLKFEVEESGFWSSLPYLVLLITTISNGYLCDWLVHKKHMSTLFARKLFTTIGGIGPGIFMVAAFYSSCNKILAVAMFTIAMGVMGPYFSGQKVNPLDLAPNFAGTVMAIANGIGGLAGIAAPYIVGYLTPNRTRKEWELVFWISFIIFTASCIIYWLFASAEVQWWNHPPRRDSGGEEGGTTGTKKV